MIRRPLRNLSQRLGLAVFQFGIVASMTLVVIDSALSDDAASSSSKLAKAGTAPATDARKISAEQLSARIDKLLAAVWKEKQITPAPLTSDEEFVRRIHLDIIGRVPSVAETLEFTSDTRPDKRQRLLEQLLERGAWAAHFANTWRDLMLAGASAPEIRGQTFGLEMWLRLRFAVNMPFDRVVRELLTADAPAPAMMAAEMSEPSPAAYYRAAEGKPEVLAANTSRLFLGMQLQCAQCHDHPFTAWKQKQFWQFAAFFQETGLAPTSASGAADESSKAEDGIRIPDTEITVTPTFLDGSKPEAKAGEAKRNVLARWITSPDNPYFARATVNRLWDHFFGRGFVHPVDNLDPTNAPCHEELFEEVTRQFVLHNFDMKYLLQSIVGSQAYQRSGRQAEGVTLTREQSEKQLTYFGRMPLRRMTSDQLFASFVEATGFKEANATADGQTPARAEFQDRFTDTSVPRTEVPTSILQALALMNGKHVAEATDLKQSRALTAIAEAPYLDTKGRIEMLFVTAFSRKPSGKELEEMTAYVADKSHNSEKEALADVFWSMLNSAEFVLNH
jgi:hypothetical protein